MISVVVPVRDEERTVEPLYDELASALGGLHEPWEVVYVDDGSRDGTHAALARLHESTTNVRVVRLRRNAGKAAALDVPLVLSGHTHGGQVVLPLIGAVAAQKFPVVAGIGRRDRTTMFVSRGVGTIYLPVRINCPPEVALLTLQPA